MPQRRQSDLTNAFGVGLRRQLAASNAAATSRARRAWCKSARELLEWRRSGVKGRGGGCAMGNDVSFTVVHSDNDWDNNIGAWRCPALRIPGAEVAAVYASGAQQDQAKYRVDKANNLIRWPNRADRPDTITADIRLGRSLATGASTAWIAAIAAVLSAAIGAFGAYMAGQKDAPVLPVQTLPGNKDASVSPVETPPRTKTAHAVDPLCKAPLRKELDLIMRIPHSILSETELNPRIVRSRDYMIRATALLKTTETDADFADNARKALESVPRWLTQDPKFERPNLLELEEIRLRAMAPFEEALTGLKAKIDMRCP